MKYRILILVFSTFFVKNIFGQLDSTSKVKSTDKTQYIFNPKKIKINTLGLYFSPEIGVNSLDNKSAPIAAGSFMLLINKKLAIGFTGQMTGHPNNKNELLKLGYGGLKMEYTIKPNAKVHASFPLVIGAGFANNDSMRHDRNFNNFHRGPKSMKKPEFEMNRSGNQFFIIQPGVNLEANLMKYVKIFGGVNYRLATKTNERRNVINTDTISAKQISGLTATIGLKIGFFNYGLQKRDSLSRKRHK